MSTIVDKVLVNHWLTFVKPTSESWTPDPTASHDNTSRRGNSALAPSSGVRIPLGDSSQTFHGMSGYFLESPTPNANSQLQSNPAGLSCRSRSISPCNFARTVEG